MTDIAPQEIATKIRNEMLQRQDRIIHSKLYARCDLCGTCFKALELTIVEHEQQHLISDSPNEFLVKCIMEAETTQLVCASCIDDIEVAQEDDYDICDADKEFEPDNGKCMNCDYLEICDETYRER